MFGFSPVIVSLVMNSISSSPVSLLGNGSKTESFIPWRGLRQGDAISPFFCPLFGKIRGDDFAGSAGWRPISYSNHLR